MTCRLQHDTEPEERNCRACMSEGRIYGVRQMMAVAIAVLLACGLSGCVTVECEGPARIKHNPALNLPKKCLMGTRCESDFRRKAAGEPIAEEKR